MMPTSGIVSIPCAAAAERVVQLLADSKHPSKLLSAMACRAARRKELEHAALGHGNHVVQRKSPHLVGFNSLPVASLLSPAAAASSPLMSMEATSPSPPLGKLSPPPAHRSPGVEVQVVPMIQDRSSFSVPLVHMRTRFCSRVQDARYVPFDKEMVTLCFAVCW